jgi:hypothetical protein
MAFKLPFLSWQPWFDLLLDYSLKTKSKDELSNYLSPSISFSVFCTGWASATFSTEVPSWAAMTPRQGQGAPSMLLCGDLDFGNYSPQHDSEFFSPTSSFPLFFYLACKSVTQSYIPECFRCVGYCVSFSQGSSIMCVLVLKRNTSCSSTS